MQGVRQGSITALRYCFAFLSFASLPAAFRWISRITKVEPPEQEVAVLCEHQDSRKYWVGLVHDEEEAARAYWRTRELIKVGKVEGTQLPRTTRDAKTRK